MNYYLNNFRHRSGRVVACLASLVVCSLIVQDALARGGRGGGHSRGGGARSSGRGFSSGMGSVRHSSRSSFSRGTSRSQFSNASRGGSSGLRTSGLSRGAAAGISAGVGASALHNLGNSGAGRPGADRPGADRPGAGKPGVGKPGVGKPGVGKPGVGRPGIRPGRPGPGGPGVGRPGIHRHPGDWHHHCGYHHNDWIYDRWDHWDDYWKWRAVSGAIRLGAYYLTRPTYYTVVYYDGVYYYYSDGVYYRRNGGVYTVVAAPMGVVVAAAPATYEVVPVQAPQGDTTTTTDSNNTTVNNYLYANGTYYEETEDKASVASPDLAAAENARADAAKGDVTDEQKQNAHTDPNAAKGGDPQDVTEDPDPGTNYKVTAPPMGATVAHLPDDAVEKTIGSTKYFTYSGSWYQAFYSGSTVVYMVVKEPSGAA